MKTDDGAGARKQHTEDCPYEVNPEYCVCNAMGPGEVGSVPEVDGGRWQWNGHALVPVPPISTRESIVRDREMGIKVAWNGSYTDLPEDDKSGVGSVGQRERNPPGCICEFAHPSCSYCEAELVKLREALRWIPVEEKLPEGELVGIFTSRFNNYLARRRGEYFEFSLGGKLHVWEISDGQATFDYEAVTHWRPLPAPPDVKVGEALGETGPEEK
jgi:hypothetical protein